MKSLLKKLTPEWLRQLSRVPRRAYRSTLDWFRHTTAWTLVRFYRAYNRYIRTGFLSPDAHSLLRNAYRMSDGRLTEFLVDRLAAKVPAVPESAGAGIAPALDASGRAEALQDLRRDGIHVFKQRLAPEVCRELLSFAENSPCSARGDDFQGWGGTVPRFDPNQVTAPAYFFSAQQLADNPTIQKLILDPGLLRIAQEYLGLEPMLNIITMWWSVPFKDRADSTAAQLYHYDLDRPRFLKIFFYLVDVGMDNGPHAYVKRTHLRKKRPMRDVRRFSDEEVASLHPAGDLFDAIGPQGTMVVADTRGLHKGTPLVAGSRLILQFEYVSDRFGYPQPTIQMREKFPAEFREWKKRHPRYLCRFTDDPALKSTADLDVI